MNFERILVTGGAGFIGTHLVEQLVAQNRCVRVMEKPGVPTEHLPTNKVEIVYADLRDAPAVQKAVMGCDLVLHLAANPNLWARDPREFEEVNHQGTRTVLHAARVHHIRRVVYVSTESILSPPGRKDLITEHARTKLEDMIGPYCRSKWLAEHAAFEAAAAGDPVVIVRPSIPVGPGDRHMGPLTRTIRDFCNGRIKAYLDGDLNLIDVSDVASGIWAAAQRGQGDRPFLLVNENWTILGLFRQIAQIIGRPVPRWRIPYVMAILFAYLEEGIRKYWATQRPPMATVTGVKLTQRSMHFEGAQSVKSLGLPPRRDCRKAIVESINWLSAQGLIRIRRPFQ